MPDTKENIATDSTSSPQAAVTEKKEVQNNIERRSITFENSELRISEDGKPMLSGYAAKFNTWTKISGYFGEFEEKIDPSFFDDVLKDDVRCLKNHNPDLIIGRSTNGTLRMKTNSVGLRYENDLPDTNTGRDVREEVRTGLITGCSFAFSLPDEGGQKWVRVDGKLPQRTLLKCEKLYDCGPVTYPAYSDTTVAARSLEAVKNQNTEVSSQKTVEKKSDQSDTSNKSESSDGSDKSDKKEVSPERMRKLKAGYRNAKQILNRLKQAEA